MKIIIISISSLALLTLSFFIGLYLGAEKYLLADSSNQAIIISGELQRLRAGHTADLIYVKEAGLTYQFSLHEQHLKDPLNWFFPLVTHVTENSESHMKAAVEYRLEYPYEYKKWWGEGWKGQVTEDMKNGVLSINQAQKRMIEKYK